MTRSAALPLAQTQAWLLGVITHPNSAEAGVESQAHLVAPSQLSAAVCGDAERPALERLAIYHDSFFSRLQECLADDYQALRSALGADAFGALCRDYVQAHPPSGPNLNPYGARLPEFVRTHEATSDAWYAELAQLEWAIVEVIHAAAEAPVSVAALASISPAQLPQVTFRATPALRLFNFRHDVNAYLQGVIDGRQPEAPKARDTAVLVLRQGFRMRRLELPCAQARVLARLLEGAPLGSALTDLDLGLGIQPSEQQQVVQAWFRSWMELGVFSAVTAPSSDTPQR